jgi:hypothetical protein
VTAGTSGLEALLAPIGIDDFFERYWEQQYLHLPRRSPGYYGSLLTAAELEKIVSNPDARFPALQLARGGGYLSPSIYTRDEKFGSETFTGVPDLQRIGTEYRNGASIVLPALHRTCPALKELCARLRSQLDHVPHANVYITPGNAAGFTPHYDVHEVFVLQIAGRKRWSLYPPILQLPHRSEPFSPQGYVVPQPMAQMELGAGDLLYLPRGFIHSAATSDSYSAHVTIGISVFTWSDLIRDLHDTSPEDLRLRQALPAGFARRDELKPVLKQRLVDLLGQRTGVDHDSLIDAFRRRVRAGESASPEPFRIDVVAIDAQTALRTPAVSQYRIVTAADSTVLEFEGKRYVLPADLAATLGSITERSIFRTAELPAHVPAEMRLGLTRYLLDIGFLSL